MALLHSFNPSHPITLPIKRRGAIGMSRKEYIYEETLVLPKKWNRQSKIDENSSRLLGLEHPAIVVGKRVPL